MKADLDQIAFHLDAADKALDAGYSNGAWTEIISAAAILDNLILTVVQDQETALVPVVEPQRAMAMAAAA